METFFIGDTHFGHKNILVYEKDSRPFLTMEEHNEALVNNWNKKVSKKDVVWHLGDFCFGKQNISIASQLNGDKRLILGNHDVYDTEDYLKYFTKVYGVLLYKTWALSHMPLYDSPRWELNVHGHIHSKILDTGSEKLNQKYFNVSCENIGLTPISLDEINFIRWERIKTV